MVNRAGLALVKSRQFGRFEVADVEDVGYRQLASCRTFRSVTLVQLIVKHKELLVRYIEHGALVDVLCTGVGGARDQLGEIADLVRDVVYRECVYSTALMSVPESDGWIFSDNNTRDILPSL